MMTLYRFHSGPFVLSLLLAISVLTAAARSQSVMPDSVAYRSAIERSFQDAMKLFSEERYRSAEAAFRRIIVQAGATHRTSAAYLMAAKSLYRLGEYRSSSSLLREFLDRFRNSDYRDDALYTLGLNSYQLEQYEASADFFLRVVQGSAETLLTGRSGGMLEAVAAANLEIPALRNLLRDATKPETRGIISIALAEKILLTGDVRGARESLQAVLALPPGTPKRAEAQAMLDRIDRSGVVKVGVVLPLTSKADQSSVQEIGEAMLSGIQLAADEYNEVATPKVRLDVRDSGRDAGVAAREVSLLASDDEVLAIVGPVFSNEVFASAGLAARQGIPLITPTATSVGIAALGESIFQANPDFIVRGQAIAQYAVQALGARRFGVLSASDTMNKLMTAAFTEEVLKLGGEIVAAEWYDPGQTDLRDELTRMRQSGLELTEPIVVNFAGKPRPAELKRMAAWGVPQHVLDSVVVAGSLMPVQQLFGENGIRIADSLKIPTQRIKVKYDSLGIPVNSIDAMFVPIARTDEIGVVTSQIRYFNFRTQLLGTGTWNDLSELEQHRQYSNGVIFGSDTHWEEIDRNVQQFLRQYQAKHGKSPDVNAMIGYDAMKLLLRALQQGATRRHEVVAALGSGRTFEGVHSKIIIGPGRVNSFLTILQFKARAIKKVGGIDVSRSLIDFSR